MGRQYGALMKDELRSEYEMVCSYFTARGYTEDETGADAREATALQAKRMHEIRARCVILSGPGLFSVVLSAESRRCIFRIYT